MRKHYLMMILIGTIMIGCGSDETYVIAPETTPEIPSLYDLVDANCVAVERAAFKFALDNGGSFPSSVSDVNESGKTLIDYLPGGSKLINPVTELPTEPRDMFRPPEGDPTGATEYSSYDGEADGFYEGFLVTGFTDSTIQPSQPWIVLCNAPAERGYCGE